MTSQLPVQRVERTERVARAERVTRCALGLLLFAALVLRLRVAWAGLHTLILDVTSDDAYYYFQIARNLAEGSGASFDGETLTNGFHPLWLVALVPLYVVGGDPVTLLHWGLTVSALFGVATVYLVYAILYRLSDNSAAALAGASFTALHPALVRESVNGMETALVVCSIAWVIDRFLRVARAPAPARTAEVVWLGVASGLMMWARTDTLFILPPMALYLFVRERGVRRWQLSLALGAPALLILTPWVVWNLVSFGTIVQTSGVAIAGFEQDAWIAREGADWSTLLGRAWTLTWESFFRRMPHLYFVPLGAPTWPFFVAIGGAAAIVLLAPLPPRGRTLRRFALLAVPSSGIVFALVYHAAVRWWIREWYFAPVALLAALGLGLVIAYLHEALRGRRSGLIALYSLFAAALIGGFGPHMADRWGLHSRHRVNQLEAAHWIATNTPSDARIGAFNAGIIGYFSHRTVVNLDGVVNADAYRAKREKRLFEYAREMHLDYVVDFGGELRKLRCGAEDGRSCETVAVVGERLVDVQILDGGFARVTRTLGGGRIHVLALSPSNPGSAGR
ncbi:MAG: glycosyltransferase family 39 protein [Myxococcota bacterium]